MSKRKRELANHSFARKHPDVPKLFVKEIILSSLNVLAPFMKNQLTVNLRIYFCALSVLFHGSICLFLCQYHSLDYCSSVVSFEVEICESFNFVLLQGFWLFWSPWIFVLILGWTYQFLQKSSMRLFYPHLRTLFHCF